MARYEAAGTRRPKRLRPDHRGRIISPRVRAPIRGSKASNCSSGDLEVCLIPLLYLRRIFRNRKGEVLDRRLVSQAWCPRLTAAFKFSFNSDGERGDCVLRKSSSAFCTALSSICKAPSHFSRFSSLAYFPTVDPQRRGTSRSRS
jgi:hypothetical protein